MSADSLYGAELVLAAAGEDEHKVGGGTGRWTVAMSGGVDGEPEGEEGGEGARAEGEEE